MNAPSTSFAGPLVGWLTDYYVLATPLLLVAFVGWRWVRQPAHRIMVAWTVMLELIVLAVICALPSWPRVSLIATTPHKAVAESSSVGDHGFVVRPPNPSAPVAKETSVSGRPLKLEASEPLASPVRAKSRFGWKGLIAVGYLAGAALVGLWLCWGVAATTWVCRRARPAAAPLQMELSQLVQGNGRQPRLLVSPHVVNAAALGVLRPTIVLPAGLAESGPPHTLRAVLSHEWAHIRNRDLWLLALGRCLLAVLFAHPLFWWLRRAMRSDQELLADAVAAGDNRQAYAEELLCLVRKTPCPSPIVVSEAVGIWEGSSQLSRRIAVLLDERFRVEPTGSRRWQCRALAPLVLLGAACSLVTLQPARSADEPTDRADASQSAAENPANEADGGEGLKIVGYLSSSSFGSTRSGDPGGSIVLPGYRLLMYQEVLQELSITAEQKEKLKEIEAQYHADLREVYRKNREEKRKLSPEAFMSMQAEQKKKIQKQLEVALTPEQTRALKDLAFHAAAFSRLMKPEACEKLAITGEQEDRLHLVREEAKRRAKREFQETPDKLLAVLTPQQQAQLQVATLGPDRLGDNRVLAVVAVGETKVQVPSTLPYPDLSEQQVQEELGLNVIQQSRVREILGVSPNLTGKLVRELQSLPPEERKIKMSGSGFAASGRGSKEWMEKLQAEVDKQRRKSQADFEKHPVVKTCIELRKQFEAVLTPEQLAAYKDMAVRRIAETALMDSRLQDEVGASDEQKAALQRILDESLVNYRQFEREMGQKMLKVLSPPQQEKLREGIDQQQW